ncbi:hypothetical protein HU752_014415 [Pseudomonas vanderleydeniana]|uniref:Uncharacterized protein n=2 Tax=Pseudomonas vanderleydeniana TaxID=2745495 RepID=A0A9E6PRR9_9PSED|nr:hypothetical protein HU752_014415 [Pseudomonas vanderleydeniana]
MDTQAGPIPAKRMDRFTARHFCAWLLFGVMLYISPELDRLFNLWIMVVPLFLIPALIASGSFILGLLINLWTRRWRRLVCVVTAPAMTFGLFAVLWHYQIGADWIYFQFKRHEYEEQLRNLPGPHPRYNEWDWGATGSAISASSSYTLVYDETDTPLEQFKRRRSWAADLSAKAYGQHFFLVSEWY